MAKLDSNKLRSQFTMNILGGLQRRILTSQLESEGLDITPIAPAPTVKAGLFSNFLAETKIGKDTIKEEQDEELASLEDESIKESDSALTTSRVLQEECCCKSANCGT